MSINLYQNFGGVYFQDSAPGQQANSVSFPNAYGQIRQIPVYAYSYETNTGKKIKALLGYRIEADITITMVSAGDSTLIYNFMTMLNNLHNVGGQVLPLYVYPRLESAMLINDYYAMHLISGIAPEDISKQVKVGQTFNLSFESVELVNRISTNINLQADSATITIGGVTTDMTITIAGSTDDATIIGSKE